MAGVRPFITTSGGTWGLQIGVEAVEVVMIHSNEKVSKSCFRVGPVGRHASASTDWKLDTEIPTYSPAKGDLADFGERNPERGRSPCSINSALLIAQSWPSDS